jgi:hypothetical protein
MKFLQVAVCALIAGTSAIRMNSQAVPVSTVHIHANYHDDFDGAVPLTPA